MLDRNPAVQHASHRCVIIAITRKRNSGAAMTACLQFARRFVLSIACLPLACVGDASAQVRDGSFQFGLVGDPGYTAAGVDEFKRLLAAINRTDYSRRGFSERPEGLQSESSRRSDALRGREVQGRP